MKRILVTGSNRGIGLELVRQYLMRGDRVFAGCRYPKSARDLHFLEYDYPERLTLVKIDVTDSKSIDAAQTVVSQSVEGLDILFNNAGIYIGRETITNVQADDLILSMRVNAVGPVIVAQSFLGLLEDGNRPSVVNISSEAGSISSMQEFRGYSYFASKAALNMLTRALALDEHMQDIISIAIHPGWVRTSMGGSMAPLTVKESVKGIIGVVNGLSGIDSGKFLTHEGDEYPW